MRASANGAVTEVVPGHVRVRKVGLADYVKVWHDMQAFTASRNERSEDEIWLVEHPPVYTLGLNGKREHIHDAGAVPVVACDRGGQVTYHAPGQIVAYALLDLRRRKLSVKGLVDKLEQAVIDLLEEYGVRGTRRSGAPGVYVNDAKIAALGLRVRRGCSYHGLSLNVAMDLAPFLRINPCGYEGLSVTQLSALVPGIDVPAAEPRLVAHLQEQLAR